MEHAFPRSCSERPIKVSAVTGDQTELVSGSIPLCLKVCGKTLTWFCFDLQCVPRDFHHRLSHVVFCSCSRLLIETILSWGSRTRQCLDSITNHRSGFVFSAKFTYPPLQWQDLCKFTEFTEQMRRLEVEKEKDNIAALGRVAGSRYVMLLDSV